VRKTVESLRQRSVTVRVLSTGQILKAGEVTFEVLHPPPVGPDGNENARSLVLWIQHAGHTILLTGDLEGPGLEQVVKRRPPMVDVLMAPHHGNRIATASMMDWAKPRVVVSCQGPPRSLSKKVENDARKPPLLGTWPHGAITIHSQNGSLTIETFISQKSWRLDPVAGQ
jgi:competence protein ComEC